MRDVEELVDSLARTNHSPSLRQAEILASHRDVCIENAATAEGHISYLESEIDRLSQKMQSLRNEQEEHQRKARYYSSFLSPLRSLPFEVLAIIFTHYLPEEVRPRAVSSPLALSHVCSTWRSAVHSTASLWTRLSIDSFRYSAGKSDDENLVELVSTWLAKAGGLPMTFSLNSRSWSFSISMPIIEAALQFLAHFEKLILNVNDVGEIYPFLTHPHGNLTHLKRLDLQVEYCYNQEHFDISHSTPLLSSVSFKFSATSRFPVLLPWKQLTRLDVQSVLEPPSWWQIFSQLTSLQYGSFVVGHSPELSATLSDLHSYPSLIELKIKVGGLPHHFLSRLRFPALQSLQLICTSSITSFSAIQHFSPVSIRELVLGGVMAGDVDTMTFLHTFPSLEKLAIYVPDVYPKDLFNSLKMQPVSFLPNLKSFTVCMALTPNLFAETARDFCHFVNMWCERKEGLDEVALHVWTGDDMIYVELFLDLVKRSLRSLSYQIDDKPTGFVLTTQAGYGWFSFTHWNLGTGI